MDPTQENTSHSCRSTFTCSALYSGEIDRNVSLQVCPKCQKWRKRRSAAGLLVSLSCPAPCATAPPLSVRKTPAPTPRVPESPPILLLLKYPEVPVAPYMPFVFLRGLSLWLSISPVNKNTLLIAKFEAKSCGIPHTLFHILHTV